MRVLGVIPARWASTRLPGKPLAEIAGRPMIAHVLARAQKARALAEVIVATDDPRIAEAVRAAGGVVAMTGADHVSGTDRIWEAVQGRDFEAVINIQGDEPLIDPDLIDAVAIPLLTAPRPRVVTAAAPLYEDPALSSVVKVVIDQRGDALYFSRAAIPHGGAALHHVGIYGYTREALSDFVSRAPGPLERAERLEQLRFLEYGDRIRVVRVERAPVSVDTPEDLARVRHILERTGA